MIIINVNNYAGTQPSSVTTDFPNAIGITNPITLTD